MRDGLTIGALLALCLLADGLGPWLVLVGVGALAVTRMTFERGKKPNENNRNRTQT